ncbi:PREDICTED: uncharacterized protein LOC107348782 isoform X4 [Acropora digitifera]|uniref:uncharacterized protein LOC107348782 isoform X4 n=1 Tax=Acropora digitifera TaxID=70779 RepID=UPI000779F20A|nr:PREDICTED: uncharacterized protein LOC107348782 isoform X4 [Acropora digitifera]
MPRQQFRFQLPENACRMLGYIFLMLLNCWSLMFYNRCLLQRSHSPLSISVAHYGIVVLSATFLRLLWVTKMTDKRRNYPDWSHYLKNELPMVISWALDIVCSIWSLLYITLLSLYMNTVTTSTSMIFILMFATAFGLMDQWNDISQIFVAIVPLFTSRLLVFIFKSKESNAEGFALALFTSGLIGVRWTIAQILAQKQESAQQALEEIQQLKDENDRLKLEKYQLEKEKHDVLEERDELVVQKNSLQADLRAKEAQVHRLETSAQSVEGWSEQNPAVRTCDGTYGNKQYFKCDPDSDDWVDYSELTTLSKSPKRDNHGQGYIKSILDSVFPSFFKGNSDLRFPQPRHFDSLKIDQRVVTFHDEGIPLRGTVRYTGDVEDSSGHVQSVVGLELDERHGSGTGKWKGHQLFACRRDHACFVDIESIMLEEDFDKDAERAKKKAMSQKQDKKLIDLKMQERRLIDKEIPTRSLSDNVQREASDRTCKGIVRRSNSFNSAVIVAAGESSKTDTREFIEKQQQRLDDFKKCPTSDEDVAMKDDERTDSSSLNNYNLNFDPKHFGNSPPNNKPITVQPGFSEAAFFEYVNIGKDGNEEAWRDHNNRGEFGEKTDLREAVVTVGQLLEISHDVGSQWKTLGGSLGFTEEQIHNLNKEDNYSVFEKASTLLLMWSQNMEKYATVGLLVDCLRKVELGGIAEKLLAMQLDPETGRSTRPQDPSDVSSGRMRESERNSTLSQEPVVNVAIHREGQQIEEMQGVEDQTNIEVPPGFELGTMVEVAVHGGHPTFGVIRWIGNIPQVKDKLIVGLELEQEISACSDGTFNGTRYFTCQSGRGFFCMLENCRKDSRFTPNSPSSDTVPSGKAFGSSPSPIIEGLSQPPKTLQEEFCGHMRGLQGHHNSCYLDATLYSMFAFSWVFDTILHRKRRETDLREYDDVQSVLRESIVNPLRLHGFVRADRVLHLRELLDKLSSTAGLINEEKDPEEFLNSLLKQVLKADPFLHLKSRDLSMKDGEGAYFYQIITEKDDSVKIAQVQNILEDSFFSADIILAEVPSCLILQMPRFGSRYKMYDMILPNLELDVSYIVESVPRVCNMCGLKVAQYECKSCLQTGMFKDEDNGIASCCFECHNQIHTNPKRRDHKFRPILVPRQQIKQTEEKQFLPGKQKMELFAVVCIETSHYVAFVKCGTKHDSPWCFFDSMADRKGEKNGYNIPAVTPCPEAMEWLSKDPKEILAAKERGEVPDKVRRLLGDGYLCMYQNLDMAMYK